MVSPVLLDFAVFCQHVTHGTVAPKSIKSLFGKGLTIGHGVAQLAHWLRCAGVPEARAD
jgi:hypothetical protein